MVSRVTTTSNEPARNGSGPGRRAVTWATGRLTGGQRRRRPHVDGHRQGGAGRGAEAGGDEPVAGAEVEEPAGAGRHQGDGLPHPVVEPGAGAGRPVAPVAGIGPRPLAGGLGAGGGGGRRSRDGSYAAGARGRD